MAIHDVESVDLGQLSNQNAVDMIGRHDDGREVSYAVDVFETLDGFAYGFVMAIEEVEAGVDNFRVLPELMGVVRLPMNGILQPGVITVETILLDEGPARRPFSTDELAEMDWQELTLDVEELKLVDRSSTT